MSTLRTNLVVAPQEIYTASTTQGTDLGALATTGDGRYFRYCLAGGTTLVPGKLQQSQAEDTTNWENLAIAASAIGAKTITTTGTVTLAANALAGGYVTTTTSTGAGYTYRIASHPAASAAVVTLTLEDPIVIALTTSTKIDAIPNPYNGVVVNPATATGLPVGAAVYAITNAYYGWLQVAGPTTLLADGTVVVGTSVVASNGTAGAVEALTGVQASVGTAITGIATTEYGQIFLNLS